MNIGKYSIAVLLIALTASVGAYAKEKPYKYNDQHSRAMNLWLAAGMGYDIKDHKVPSDKLGDFLDTGTGRVVDTAININILESGGMSGSTSLGVGLALFALNSMAPDKQPMRNSMWYLMKNTGQTAVEALDIFSEKLLYASMKSIVSAGYRSGSINTDEDISKYYIKGFKDTGKHVVGVFPALYVDAENSLCVPRPAPAVDESYCRLFLYVRLPEKKKFNFNGEEGDYWFFSAGDRSMYNKFEFHTYDHVTDKKSDSYQFNELKILDEISKEIGEGFYIYIAPNKTFMGDGKKVGTPLIIENGNHLIFVSKE